MYGRVACLVVCLVAFLADFGDAQCSGGGGLVAVPGGACHQYLDCSQTGTDQKQECKYPEVFDDISEKCMSYEGVNCGSRPIKVDACNYKANTCNGHSHCKPCIYRYPSCAKLSDGKNKVNYITEINPMYIECKNKRIVGGVQTCPKGDDDAQLLFDPSTKTCTKKENINVDVN